MRNVARGHLLERALFPVSVPPRFLPGVLPLHLRLSLNPPMI
jgi:hypothetical protein